MRHPHHESLSKLVVLFSVAFLSLPSKAAATSMVPLTLDERVQKASEVIVATVVAADAQRKGELARFIETEYTLRVEEVVFGALQRNEVLTIRLWGGTIGEETLTAAGVRVPEVGRRYFFMLTPAWRTSNWGVIVGTDQGMFEVVRDEVRGSDRIVDFKGRTLERTPTSSNELLNADGAESALAVPDFISWIQRARAGGPTRPSGDAPVGVDAAATEYSIAAVERGDFIPSAVPLNCRVGLWLHFETYASDSPFYLTDIREMQKWNFYSVVFGWDDTPNGDRRIGNGRNDIHGLLNDQQMQVAWGRPWDGELAVTSWRCLSGFMAEADIAINANYDWTFDDELVFSGEAFPNVYPYRQTMLHELGHAAGLDHDFDTLSVMNYTDSKRHRAYAFPYMHDAEAVRNSASHAVVARKDLAVYPFRWTPQRRELLDGTIRSIWSDLSFSITTLVAGMSLRVSGFHLENVGTVTVDNPALNWYLTQQRFYPNGQIPYLGRSVFPLSLPRFGDVPSSMTDVALQVPPDVRAGSYYVSALIDLVGGVRPSQPTFPYAHNAFFTRQRIRVLPRITGLTDLFVVGGETGYATVFLSSPADELGHELYLRFPAGGPISGPDQQVLRIPPGADRLTFPISTVAVNAEQTVTIRVMDRLGFEERSAGIRLLRAGLSIVEPSPLAHWVVGSETIVRWSHGLFEGSVVFVALSRDGGVTYQNLGSASNLAATGEFKWKVTGPATNAARLRLTFGTAAMAEVAITIGMTDAVPWQQRSDFDGDGLGDLILQHQATGCMVAWHMTGTSLLKQSWVAPDCVADPAWSIRGVADFDRDGKPDLLFQNISTGGILVWLMNGTALRQQLWLTPSAVSDPAWLVAAVADMNGDKAPDLVFQHRGDGRMLSWHLGGAAGTILQQQMFLTPSAVADPDWQIVGAGDIDGDTKPDLFFKHARTGVMVAWLMNGVVIRTQQNIFPGQVSAEWAVAAIADTNRDGKPDLVFQNTLSGHMVAWPLSGTTLLGQQWIVPNQVSDPRWRIVGPR